ncbi:MAG: HEPN domain-containing protein [Caldilineales bacterium]|nr:HEPN domain-containing protein [Caldilineales bacterium]MCW5858868.1 HEPN domain-containing protein [Caldilineales bacterium]
MSLDKPVVGSAADWLRRARSDLALASVTLPRGVLYNELCFHAQQAAEKSIKAVLVHHGIDFRRSHDIDYLLSLLPDEAPLPPELEWVIDLTSYAVALRYPGDYEEVTIEQYQEALAAARTVVNWAERLLHALS